MGIEGAGRETGNALGALGKGVVDGIGTGISTAAHGAVDSARHSLEVATDLSSPDAENFALLFAKSLIGGAVKLGGAVVSGGLNVIESAVKSIPSALGHTGNAVLELLTPEKKNAATTAPDASSSKVAALGIPPEGFKPSPTPRNGVSQDRGVV